MLKGTLLTKFCCATNKVFIEVRTKVLQPQKEKLSKLVKYNLILIDSLRNQFLLCINFLAFKNKASAPVCFSRMQDRSTPCSLKQRWLVARFKLAGFVLINFSTHSFPRKKSASLFLPLAHSSLFFLITRAGRAGAVMLVDNQKINLSMLPKFAQKTAMPGESKQVEALGWHV